MTKIRPEVSKKNPYYISRYRFYELKYFCLQYSDWKRNLSVLNVVVHTDYTEKVSDSVKKDIIVDCVVARGYYKKRIDLIWKAAKLTDDTLATYILEAVTKGEGYAYLKTAMNIPCGKDLYYKLYHKFFYVLDKLLKKMEDNT